MGVLRDARIRNGMVVYCKPCNDTLIKNASRIFTKSKNPSTGEFGEFGDLFGDLFGNRKKY